MKYRKRPVVVEAVQFLGFDSGGSAVFDFDKQGEHEPSWIWGNFQNETITYSDTGNLIIKTLEGDHRANVDDYIIQGVKGELYPCKPDIFKQTYDIVD